MLVLRPLTCEKLTLDRVAAHYRSVPLLRRTASFELYGL